MAPEITRTIRFYAIDWTTESNAHVSKSNKFIRDILLNARDVKYGDNEHIIINEFYNSSEITEMKFDDYTIHSDTESCLILSRIRKTDFPQISDMEAKTVEPLQIAEDKGLRDPAHFILFGDGAFIGAESNRQARDVATAVQLILSKWVREHGKEHNLKDVTITKIKKQDVDPKVFDHLRSLTIASSSGFTKNMMDKEHRLRSVINSNANAELVLTIKEDQNKIREMRQAHKKEKGKKKEIIKEGIKGLLDYVSELLEDEEGKKSLDEFTMFKISGMKKDGNGKYVEVNILDDLMVVKKPIIRLDDTTRGVNPGSMYTAIIETYYENMEDINQYLPTIKQ